MDTAELFSVAGKTALVTGGSSGIGAMIAAGLRSAGANVTIVSRSLSEPDWSGSHIRGDLSTMEGTNAVAEAFRRNEDRLHILVNAAGMHISEPLDAFSEVNWDSVVDLNVKHPFFLTQHLLGALRGAALPDDPARVLNIASSGGLHVPRLDNYSYSASKAALIHLSRHLALRLAPDNINVNTIAPGPVPSRMFRDTSESFRDELANTIPRQRLGQHEDFVGAAIYLSSRAGAYITGSVLSIDGGMVALL